MRDPDEMRRWLDQSGGGVQREETWVGMKSNLTDPGDGWR